jgi:hypothetical protein
MAPAIVPSNIARSRKTSTAAMATGMAAAHTPIVCVPTIQISAAMRQLGKLPIHQEGQALADVQPIRKSKR